MSEEKRIEQEIGWYKVAFAILIATGVSLLAWFAQNYTLAEPVLLIFALTGIFIVSMTIYSINKKVFECLDRLEEL
jgi:4-hydroxybenzoate polyprenyltransferase